MSKKQKKDKAACSTRQLMGIEEIKDYCIATRMGNLVFFIIKPTNISVLPDSSISARIYALLNVVKGQAEIEMLALNSKESFERNKDFYVACCGTSIQPVLQMLEQAPQLDTILLCLDNDEAGHQASRRMREQLEMRYSVERLIPENKDWNDDLNLSIENAQGFAMNEMR